MLRLSDPANDTAVQRRAGEGSGENPRSRALRESPEVTHRHGDAADQYGEEDDRGDDQPDDDSEEPGQAAGCSEGMTNLPNNQSGSHQRNGTRGQSQNERPQGRRGSLHR